MNPLIVSLEIDLDADNEESPEMTDNRAAQLNIV
jgi:hypothetical protein